MRALFTVYIKAMFDPINSWAFRERDLPLSKRVGDPTALPGSPLPFFNFFTIHSKKGADYAIPMLSQMPEKYSCSNRSILVLYRLRHGDHLASFGRYEERLRLKGESTNGSSSTNTHIGQFMNVCLSQPTLKYLLFMACREKLILPIPALASEYNLSCSSLPVSHEETYDSW